ncbi:uncharacterized protein N7458_003748 [Penicillium daleae]|uniref:Uncharacterized protein n=1 Tax=Penicillium daleae TaxID=63821 RepID=A0AAD6G3Y6_9EURO|nr:uncharacterized protein N7458_003748 [Penicillium daleae]KAJ5455484.1 hypothetical protein N7458_003748 [Penicillium daleae]
MSPPRYKSSSFSIVQGQLLRLREEIKPVIWGSCRWYIMLRAHCPIRTVEEEQQELFKDAKPCTVPDATFARAVDRAL